MSDVRPHLSPVTLLSLHLSLSLTSSTRIARWTKGNLNPSNKQQATHSIRIAAESEVCDIIIIDEIPRHADPHVLVNNLASLTTTSVELSWAAMSTVFSIMSDYSSATFVGEYPLMCMHALDE